MLILAASSLLFLAPTIITAVRYFRPKFRQYWLSCVLAGAIALVLLLLATFLKPGEINLSTWRPEELFPLSPLLLADRITWMFSLSLTVLLLAALLVSATQKTFTRQSFHDVIQWLGLLYLTSVTIFSLMAGNLLTLIFAWTALDIAELLIWLAIPGVRPDAKKLAVNLAARFTSLYILFFAGVISFSAYLPSGFSDLNPPVRALIYTACTLRLTALPLSSPLYGGDRQPSLALDILQIMPFGTYLILLARLSQPVQGTSINTALFIILAFLSTGFALLWAFNKNKTSGLPHWLVSTALLCLCASYLGQPEGSVVWGLTVIFSGGLLYLYFSRRKTSRLILYFGLFNLTILPLSATWLFVNLFSEPASPLVYLLFIPLGLILAGYFDFIVKQDRESLGAERWMLLIYPAGLLLLPLINFVTVWFGVQTGLFSAGLIPPLSASWPGLAVISAAGLVLLLKSRLGSMPIRILDALRNLTSLGWLYRFVEFALRLAGLVLHTGNSVLEGRGGIIWSLLLLTLVFAVLYQS